MFVGHQSDVFRGSSANYNPEFPLSPRQNGTMGVQIYNSESSLSFNSSELILEILVEIAPGGKEDLNNL